MVKTAGVWIEKFLFRELHQTIPIGTASDRYAGWIGQIYSEGRYEKGITRRSHKVGDKTFNEETLPVESVIEYFEHFPLLEIDYTFYRLLLEKDGKPTPNFHVLKNYRQHMKEGDLLLLKVPQVIIARKLRRGAGFAENDIYLNAGIFTKQFYDPSNLISLTKIMVYGIWYSESQLNNYIMILFIFFVNKNDNKMINIPYVFILEKRKNGEEIDTILIPAGFMKVEGPHLPSAVDSIVALGVTKRGAEQSEVSKEANVRPSLHRHEANQIYCLIGDFKVEVILGREDLVQGPASILIPAGMKHTIHFAGARDIW